MKQINSNLYQCHLELYMRSFMKYYIMSVQKYRNIRYAKYYTQSLA